MENPALDVVILQLSSQMPRMELNTVVSSEPESNQETLKLRDDPPSLAVIEVRIDHLLNRRFFLLKMKSFKKRAEQNSSQTTKEMSSEDREDSEDGEDGEDGDELCELESVEKELEELLVKKEELEKAGENSHHTTKTGHQECETLYGGIYILPPPQLAQEDATLEQSTETKPVAEKPTTLIVPADSLGQTPTQTQCPSCREVIVTEIRKAVGETAWVVCCMCSMMGCLAGCCVIPFYLNCLKDVQHRCPRCQAHIHTHQPL